MLLAGMLLLREIDSATELNTEERGKAGEQRIKDMLSVFEKQGDIVINNVILPSPNGNTSQIDHILISKRGIFVIETKNIVGLVIGNDQEEYWKVYRGEQAFALYSPVKQNEGHINAIKSLFPDKTLPITNMVVFSRYNNKRVRSNYVYSPATMFMLLRSRPLNQLAQEEVNQIGEVINQYKTNPIETEEEHIKKVQEIQNKGLKTADEDE